MYTINNCISENTNGTHIFRQRTDWVKVTLNNNGCAWVEIERRSFETSYEGGECWIREARAAGYRDMGTHRYENGDVLYVLN